MQAGVTLFLSLVHPIFCFLRSLVSFFNPNVFNPSQLCHSCWQPFHDPAVWRSGQGRVKEMAAPTRISSLPHSGMGSSRSKAIIPIGARAWRELNLLLSQCPQGEGGCRKALQLQAHPSGMEWGNLSQSSIPNPNGRGRRCQPAASPWHPLTACLTFILPKKPSLTVVFSRQGREERLIFFSPHPKIHIWTKNGGNSYREAMSCN